MCLSPNHLKTQKLLFSNNKQLLISGHEKREEELIECDVKN